MAMNAQEGVKLEHALRGKSRCSVVLRWRGCRRSSVAEAMHPGVHRNKQQYAMTAVCEFQEKPELKELTRGRRV